MPPVEPGAAEAWARLVGAVDGEAALTPEAVPFDDGVTARVTVA